MHKCTINTNFAHIYYFATTIFPYFCSIMANTTHKPGRWTYDAVTYYWLEHSARTSTLPSTVKIIASF